MRREFIEVSLRKDALKRAPWAYKIVKAFGGFMAFESIDDYKIWKKQK